ncbi:hypothetical protein PMAYCL1PPCAC_22020, partial [Pristionchus mayeri]
KMEKSHRPLNSREKRRYECPANPNHCLSDSISYFLTNASDAASALIFCCSVGMFFFRYSFASVNAFIEREKIASSHLKNVLPLYHV